LVLRIALRISRQRFRLARAGDRRDLEQFNFRRLKFYPVEQVERIRIAQVLVREMGVNLAGVEVALHMREQMIRMRRELAVILRRFGEST
jgi:hypothetical protein